MADPTRRRRRTSSRRSPPLVKEFEEWVEETFGDAELAAEIKDDLGLDPTNPATPTPSDPARKARLEAFAAKQDVDEAALAEVIADIKATVDTILAFIDAAKADAVDPWTLFWGDLQGLLARRAAGAQPVGLRARAARRLATRTRRRCRSSTPPR